MTQKSTYSVREIVFLSISAVASPDVEPTDTVDQSVDMENQVIVQGTCKV